MLVAVLRAERPGPGTRLTPTGSQMRGPCLWPHRRICGSPWHYWIRVYEEKRTDGGIRGQN